VAIETSTARPSTRKRFAPQSRTRAAFDGIVTLWYRDIIRFARDRSRIIGSMAQPLLFLFIFGVGLSPAIGNLGTADQGIKYGQFIFPGIVTMSVLFTSIFGAVSVIWDREFGFLKEVLVAPVPRWSLVAGKALGGSTTAMFQGVLILLFAPLVGVSLSPLMVLKLLVMMFCTAFALSSVGLFIASRMRSMEGFQMVMNFLMMPMFFLSGALFPLANLPGWLAALTRIDPVSYGVDAIRRTILSGSVEGRATAETLGLTLFGHSLNPWFDILVVLLVGAVMITLAVNAFSTME
jgi:ABC-2 type transport system permease protein